MTISDIQDEIIKEYQDISGADKYDYLIKLGREYSPIDGRYKTEDNLVRGCQVQTWFCSNFENGKIFYHIDSSSIMVRGIIALLIRVLSDQKPEDVANADLYFIKKLNLEDDFSPVRANSLWKLTNRMRLEATQCINN